MTVLVFYGVLHEALSGVFHLACFWSVWSALELDSKDSFLGHMEYTILLFLGHMECSLWLKYGIIWSASYYCHQCLFWKKYKELHRTCFLFWCRLGVLELASKDSF